MLSRQSGGEETTSLRRAVATLAVTQIIGWGTTYYLPAVLAGDMAAGTGLPLPFVYGGISLMLVMSALVGPAAGRWLARAGARQPMMAGSAVLAAGLLLLAAAKGPVLFSLAWIVIGLGAPAALGQAASTATVQIAPTQARRAITLVLLFSALSSTVFWPILIALEARLGWRGSLVVYAGLHVAICLPLHALGLPTGKPRGPEWAGTDPGRQRDADPPPVRGAFPFAALCFSLAGFVSWGVPLLLIDVLERLGHPRTAAVTIAALLGPSQIVARLVDILGGHRLDILLVGLGALLVMPIALAAMLLGGSHTAVAVAAVFGYGLSVGLMSVVRAVAPLPLFGRAAYPVMLGRLTLPQNAVFAAAPLALATARDQWGAAGVLVLAIGAALVALAALGELVRRAAAGRVVSPAPR